MNKVIIDASGKRLGHVAGEAASLLMGKKSPAYKPNVLPAVFVEITHASQLDISVEKMEHEALEHYSGFHGGLRRRTWGKVAKEKGYREIVHHAISGMIRKNKLHKQIMKHLTISE